MAEGVRIEYAEEVYRTTPTPSGKGISLLCPTRKVMTRGDTLNLGTLSVVCCPNECRQTIPLEGSNTHVRTLKPSLMASFRSRPPTGKGLPVVVLTLTSSRLGGPMWKPGSRRARKARLSPQAASQQLSAASRMGLVFHSIRPAAASP